jgi:ketosteroid isomerase-like protein
MSVTDGPANTDPAARLTTEDPASNVAALLSRYQQAWTSGDIDAIVEMTAPDGVYEASFGPKPWGERFVGPDEIRAALVRMRIGEPGRPRHEYEETRIVGDCGFAMWRSVLDGTGGPVVTMHGADFYRFRDGKVAAKVAYRKQVEGSP